MNFSFKAPVALVAALLLSITAGFIYPGRGMHNGLLFLQACVVIALSTFELRNEKGPSAVALLMPTFMVTLAVAVVSTLCGYAGSSLGKGPELDIGAMVTYLLVTAMFGFVSTCISVNGAVSDQGAGGRSVLLPAIVIYLVVGALGLVVIADDSHSILVTVAYFVVQAIAALFMMYRSSRGQYY